MQEIVTMWMLWILSATVVGLSITLLAYNDGLKKALSELDSAKRDLDAAKKANGQLRMQIGAMQVRGMR